MEVASTLSGPWLTTQNAFSTQSSGKAIVAVEADTRFQRILAVDVSANSRGFSNLIRSYGLLEVLTGNGAGQTDDVDYWQIWFDGWPGVA